MTTRIVQFLALALLAGVPAQTPAQAQATAAQPAAKPYVKDPRFWPTPVMDRIPPPLPALKGRNAILIFSKTNGFRDSEQIIAANFSIEAIAREGGRQTIITENAAIFNSRQLRLFDTIVFNSTSGNIFTPEQRAAFAQWLKAGGGFVALHGAGGDHHYDWRWYVDTVLGAQFTGHTSKPDQFRTATIHIEMPQHPAMAGLPNPWVRVDEWYAFDRVPSGKGTHILATLDEASYAPVPEQRMGVHPIIWTRCVGRGRVFFSALGHKAETYAEPAHLRMIGNAMRWAGEAGRKGCD